MSYWTWFAAVSRVKCASCECFLPLILCSSYKMSKCFFAAGKGVQYAEKKSAIFFLT